MLNLSLTYVLSFSTYRCAEPAPARFEAEQEERQHQRQQMDISRMLTESDGLTSELVDLMIDKIYVYPDKRVDIAFKIRDSFTTHD